MKTINPQEVSVAELHGILLGAIAPRPIAFASTIDREGRVNLSPFSFFNVFGSNPPVLIFSPSRRVRGNTHKHTLENVYEVPEVVINIVNFAMVEQMSLASTEYDKGVNEFVKAGFTELASQIVKPPRVGESPVTFECKVKQIIETGTEGGAGNLIVCEVVLTHIQADILNEAGKIDQHKIDLVGRLGGDWYVRAGGNALFEVEKPLAKKGIGVDQIPAKIRLSTILTGNNLGKLGNVEQLPAEEEVKAFAQELNFADLQAQFKDDKNALEIHLHQIAQAYLTNNETLKAWKTLLLSI
ncbi:MAG: flavin reductase family protein [Microscillaceae bacterium]|jgi:flavin reductase (DIM6/NTAB) family NADH-FMN oxidoreductase RutF|nr:flavin reductase family protein [Microscillaceae bacterium]